MSRPSIRKSWFLLLPAFIGLSALILIPGCKDREKKIYLTPPVYEGPAEFGTPQALDIPPSSPAGTVTFDPSRHMAVSANGDAQIVYLADDGSGTIRMYTVRYDHSLNPIARDFTSPQILDANTGNVAGAKTLLDPWGDGLLLWIQDYSGNARLLASIYQASTHSFSPPQLIDAGGENTFPEGVAGFDSAMDAAGNVVIGFYENPASPGVCEAFGVHYDKGTRSFTAPEKVHLSSYSSPGHDVKRMIALAGPVGTGYLLTLQDSDPTGNEVKHFSVSRFSSESSLSSFNAVTPVNPPGYPDDVFDLAGVVLPSGDALLIYQQRNPHPSSLRVRIWGRVFDSVTKDFTEGLPWDLAPEASSAAVDFEYPVLTMRSDGLAVALFRSYATSGSVLHANVFRPETQSFDTNQSVVVSPAGGLVGNKTLFAFGPTGSGEAVFTQSLSGLNGPVRLFAKRFDGISRAFAGGARPCDLGAVETGSLVVPPSMAYSNPIPAGIGFDGNGRFLVAFTGSDGRLSRFFVNRGAVSDPGKFEGARPVDGATRTSPYSAIQASSDPVHGDAVLLLDASGTGGVAVWRHREVVGANTTIRLHGNSYHGFNLATGPALSGAQIVDEHPESSANRPVSVFDGAATATGAVMAFVQDAGGSDELYIRAYDAKGSQFDLHGLTSQDNGTAGAIQDVKVVAGRGDDAFIFFLQDDGSGTVHLYGRTYKGDTRSITALRGPGMNVPLSQTVIPFGSVTDLSVSAAGGWAAVAFRQAEGAGHAAFGFPVDPNGTVTGPVRLSSASASNVFAPRVWISQTARVLAMFLEGQDLMARVLPVSSYGLAPSGPPVALESASAPVGAFDADSDRLGNFLVVFETGTAGSGVTLMFRRYFNLAQAWETGPIQASDQGTATLDHLQPRIRAMGGGRAIVLFTTRDSATTPNDVSLTAVTFDSSLATPFSTPTAIDNDGSTVNGLDVADASIALEPLSGRGFVVFTQDVDLTATVRNRLYSRGFDLSCIGTANPVFYVTAVDMSAGASSAQTGIAFFHNAVGSDGKGFLLHGEVLPAGPNDTLTHLFARPYDADTFIFGQAKVASRLMTVGAGTISGEGVDAAKALLSPDGKAFLLHTVSQTDSSGPTTYRRLFANIYR